MKSWIAQTDEQRAIERMARALMAAERKSTRADDTLVFFDPFNWKGELSTPPGAYKTEHIQESRPAWTGFRIIRMANAALKAARAAEIAQ